MSSPPANPEQKSVLCKSPVLYYKMMQLAALLLLVSDFFVIHFLRSQSWVENTNMTECTQEMGSLQSDKHLPQSPFTGKFFR
jgi:hypothetical protein